MTFLRGKLRHSNFYDLDWILMFFLLCKFEFVMVLWSLLLFFMIKWDIKKLRFIGGGLELWHIGLGGLFLLFVASCLYIIKI